MKEIAAVILAAGYGKRMKSKIPKVLHKVCGKPVVSHVITAAQGAGADRTIVVISPEIDKFQEILKDNTDYCIQHERLGTGHAVLQAKDNLRNFNGDVLILLGDMPLLPSEQITKLIDSHRETAAAGTVLTAIMNDATGYGRIVRADDGTVAKIVEHRDATPQELSIKEINTGVFCFDCKKLFEALEEVSPDNDQKEYYLTDVVSIMNKKGLIVSAKVADKEEYGRGINSRLQLAEASELMRKRILLKLMDDGVTIVDPNTTYIDSSVVIGRDTIVYPMTTIEGNTRIGEDCNIGPSARVTNATLGNSVNVQNSIIVDSSIGNGCNIGPFAYIRPDSVLHENVKVGDFVELKKAEVGKGSKIPHLSYVGDASVGEGVNIGCGTITCNYDGKKKHQTVIGDRAFVGSNTNLVAPVQIGSDTLIAAGSTITRDVPDFALAVGRARQENKEKWRLRTRRNED